MKYLVPRIKETIAYPKNTSVTSHQSPVTPSISGMNSCNTTKLFPLKDYARLDGTFLQKLIGTHCLRIISVMALQAARWSIQVFQVSMLFYPVPDILIKIGIIRVLQLFSGHPLHIVLTKLGHMG